MPDDDEIKWRAEFLAAGEFEIRDAVNHRAAYGADQKKRLYAFRWPREQDEARRRREGQTYRYARWMFWAAVAAVMVGIIGTLVTWLH